ncbi:LysR family transcriptional regulator [Mesorhizobium sp. B2-5-7]|uniref:LysR family transcriptional regulator n=1 Tax=Mesorhizobium sp. BR-1-1-10 TaxID=2876660 RepID=UPI00112D8913|nr:LysR family transcriptional regulator [Mesorhizobium sp. B2-5-7]
MAGTLNWDDLRFVLAVAKHGTLSAAARHLRTTQSSDWRRRCVDQRRPCHEWCFKILDCANA